MRIALVSHKFRRGDGQGRVNLEIAREALRRGWHVWLLASEVADEILGAPGLTWVRIPVRGWPTELLRNQVFAARSALWLRRHRAALDTVCVNGFITWARAEFNAAHFIHSSWLRSPYRPAGRGAWVRRTYHWLYAALNARLERRAFLAAGTVIAVSARISRELCAIGIPPQRILVIDNGVDTSEFTPGPGDRVSLCLPAAVPVALFVGDLQLPRKNLHTVLRALVRCPGLHLAVVGSVGKSPYPALAAELGVAARVHFLGFRRDVPLLMRSVDLVVFPSLYEPSGLVLLEAMASGVPVIAAATVGGLEAIGGDGIVVVDQPEDVAAMAQALAALLDPAADRAQLGAAGRRRALQFDFRTMASRYCDAFAEALPSSARQLQGG